MLKQVGTSGQISLGKQFAGKYFQVEPQEGGVLMLRPMKVIPDSDAWLHTPEMKSKLEQARRWAAETPAAETDMAKFNAKIEAQIKARSKKSR